MNVSIENKIPAFSLNDQCRYNIVIENSYFVVNDLMERSMQLLTADLKVVEIDADERIHIVIDFSEVFSGNIPARLTWLFNELWRPFQTLKLILNKQGMICNIEVIGATEGYNDREQDEFLLKLTVTERELFTKVYGRIDNENSAGNLFLNNLLISLFPTYLDLPVTVDASETIWSTSFRSIVSNKINHRLVLYTGIVETGSEEEGISVYVGGEPGVSEHNNIDAELEEQLMDGYLESGDIRMNRIAFYFLGDYNIDMATSFINYAKAELVEDFNAGEFEHSKIIILTKIEA